MNAHQRRVARRKAKSYWGDSPSWEDLFASDGDPFDDDFDDDRQTCTACLGDGRDSFSDYLLPCDVCGGDGYFD
jgi:hypothetical protein